MLHSLLADIYSFWLPERASTIAPANDALFYFILGINVFFSSLIMILMVLFVVKYRHRGNRPHDPTGGHSTALELTWTIIPTLLVLVIFWFGFRGYLHINVMAPNAYEVTAKGKMWNWSFTYPSGLSSNELHLVVGRPARIILESEDVIHDLDIPAFRVKKDAVPGRYNRMWFEPTKIGEYNVFCAMYCGQNHSTMMAKCFIQDQDAFDKWMANAIDWKKNMSFITRGSNLYNTAGCATCHSVDGTVKTGPSWKDMYGTMQPLSDGSSVMADDDYIKESIVYPAAKIVKNFTNVMPGGYGSQLKADDITALTWYMKSISQNFKGDMAPGRAVPAGGAPTTAPTTLPSNMSPSAPPVSTPAAVPGTPPKTPE